MDPSRPGYAFWFLLAIMFLPGCSPSGPDQPLDVDAYFWTSGEGEYRNRVGIFIQLDGALGHISFLSGGQTVLGDNRKPGEIPVVSDFNTLVLDSASAVHLEAGSFILRGESDFSGNARFRFQKPYPEISHWWRDIFWEAQEIRIEDQVSFQLGQRGAPALIWNLGYRQPLEIQGSDRRYIVEGETHAYIIEANQPLKVTLKRTEGGRGVPQLWILAKPGQASYKIVTRVVPRR